MTTRAVDIRGISKSFGRVRALDGVSFQVPLHSIFGLLGPNGAGKTTLFSIIANFLKADAGDVDVLGMDVRRISQLRGRLTILPQDAQFQRNVPILDQLVFFRRLDGQTKQAAENEVRHTLALVGLESMAKRRAATLSHGMVKRLGIAQAFLGNPEVILLDEPTAGLDPAGARQIRDLVRQLQSSATVVVSSHNLAEVQELCDHVAILDYGKLVLAGTVAEITRSGMEFGVSLSRAMNEAESQRIAAIPGVRSAVVLAAGGDLPRNAANYLLTLDLSRDGTDQDKVLSDVLRAWLDMGITPRRLAESRSLETHFLNLTGAARQ